MTARLKPPAASTAESHRKALIKLLNQASHRHHLWEVFGDFIEMAAIDLAPDEWEAAVQKRADEVMAGARTVQLCKAFDAPQFAREFIAMCRNRGGCRDLTIKARAPEKYGHGQIRKTKKGAPMLSWQPYKYDAA